MDMFPLGFRKEICIPFACFGKEICIPFACLKKEEIVHKNREIAEARPISGCKICIECLSTSLVIRLGCTFKADFCGNVAHDESRSFVVGRHW